MFHKIVLIALTFFFVSCNNPNEEQIIDGKTVSKKSIINEKSGLLQTQHMTTAHTIALHLEATQTDKSDTGQVGSDTYTVYVDLKHTREYCLENDLDEGHRYTIQDKQGNTLLDISHGCSTINLDKGVYTHTLYNGTVSEGKSHAVFIHPDLTNMTPNIAQKSSKMRVYNAVQEDILIKKTVISFNTCQGCNLESLDLSNQAFDKQFQSNNLSPKMNDDYFTSLNTSESDFFSSQNMKNTDAYNGSPLNIEEASLQSSNLSYSVFRNANFNGVDFTDANLSHAVFIDSSFQGATFDHTDMTRAVFINPDYTKEFNSKTVIVSKPSISTLFYGETNHYYGNSIAAINNHNRLVVLGQYSGQYPPLPNGHHIVSPPSIVANNFTTGFSVFVKADDGYIYEYFRRGNVKLYGYKKGDYLRNVWYNKKTNKWYKMGGTSNPVIDISTNICKSNPVATFINSGGSGSNQIKNTLVCHDYNGTLHEWTRYFLNKPENAEYSEYGGWSHQSYGIPKTNAEISINHRQNYAYIDGKEEIVYHGYGSTPPDLYIDKSSNNYASNVELSTTSRDGLGDYLAFVKEDGNVYVGQISSNYTSIGHPPHGVISSPALGGKNGLEVMVLSGDGKLYHKSFDGPIDGSTDWNSATASGGTFSSSFKFTNNNLTETYIDNADLSSLDLSSNTLTKTFFTNVNLSHSSFDNTTLTDVVFDASRYFDNVSFKSATLNNVSFTNHTDDTGDSNTDHKNIISVDFTGSTIDGLTWTNNIATNAIFDGVTFKDGTITSHDNRFIGNQPVASFRKAVNVPVELVMQETTENINGLKADPLRSYDFSSASFSDSFYTLDFTDTNMAGARFGSDLKSTPVDFKSIDTRGSSWENADLSFVTCDGCNFDNTKLNNTNLYQAQMNNASFKFSSWINTNASYAQFQSGILDSIHIDSSSSIIGTSFNYSSMIKSDLHGSTLNGATFNNSSMYMSDLNGSTLNGAIFNNANLACSSMGEVNFTNSHFNSAFLNGVDFSNPISSISNADFSGAHLNGANFQSVTFGSSNLQNAIFDFNGTDIFIDQDTSCKGYTHEPVTTSSTTCPDGNKPASKCNL